MNDLIIRAPTVAEIPRALHLFGQVRLPRQAQLLVAVRSRPVERFVAALAGWPEAEFGRFQLTTLPGLAQPELASLLIEELAKVARAGGLKKLMYAKLLTDDDQETALLRNNGFEIMRSERFFHLPAALAQTRVLHLLEKYREEIPPEWHTESIRDHSPETVFDLIAPYRLMTRQELQSYWELGGQNAFDPNLSSILFDQQQPFGTLLARRKADTLCYDVRVVRHSNPRLRALANLCLFHHCIKKHDLSNPVKSLQFRGGEQEHRETANLAFRMGGTELPVRHVFTKTV